MLYEGVLISTQPDLLPVVVGRNGQCRWTQGSVHVPNCKPFLVTEAERKHARRRARFQQHRDASFLSFSLSLSLLRQGKAPKEIHVIMTETLGERVPSYVTVKNWVAQVKRGDFSTCNAPRPGGPKTLTTPEVTEQIHQLILEDHRIPAKSIADQLDISRERVGSIIHEDLDMRKLPAKWVPKCLNADQKRQRCQQSEKILDFFRRDQNDFLSRLVTMVETWLYIMTRRQSNIQWSGGIAAHPAPKKSRVQKFAVKFSPRFLGSRRHPPH